MKMTKKRFSALQRIVGREQEHYDHDALERNKTSGSNKLFQSKVAGVHPSGEHFAVTDGNLVVIFTEKPGDLPEAGRADTFDQFVQNFLKDSDCWLVSNPPTVDDCKKVIREWKGMKTFGKPLAPKITVTTRDGKGNSMTSCFDARLYIDALESVGSYRNVYIGNSETAKVPFPCLLVYKRYGREDWQDVNWDEPVILLPCRP